MASHTVDQSTETVTAYVYFQTSSMNWFGMTTATSHREFFVPSAGIITQVNPSIDSMICQFAIDPTTGESFTLSQLTSVTGVTGDESFVEYDTVQIAKSVVDSWVDIAVKTKAFNDASKVIADAKKLAQAALPEFKSPMENFLEKYDSAINKSVEATYAYTLTGATTLFDEAIELYNSCLTLSSKRQLVYYNIAYCYAYKNDLGKIIENLQLSKRNGLTDWARVIADAKFAGAITDYRETPEFVSFIKDMVSATPHRVSKKDSEFVTSYVTRHGISEQAQPSAQTPTDSLIYSILGSMMTGGSGSASLQSLLEAMFTMPPSNISSNIASPAGGEQETD
jgi:hypothetical protein